MRQVLISIIALLVAVPIAATADFMSTPVDAHDVSTVTRTDGPATPDGNRGQWWSFDIAQDLAYGDGIGRDDLAAASAVARSVAEPRTLLLLGLGLIAIGCVKRRK